MMTDALPEVPRDEEMLGNLAEMDLAFARFVYRRGLEAGSVEEVEVLARVYQRLARCCRMSIFLRDKLIRERAKAAAEAPPPAPEPLSPAEKARIARRKEQLFDAVARVVWSESEREDLEVNFDALRHRLHDLPLPDDFADVPLDDQVVAWCDQFGFRPSVAAAWRDLPRLPDELAPDDLAPDEDAEDEGADDRACEPDVQSSA